jgi:hypothetical protein
VAAAEPLEVIEIETGVHSEEPDWAMRDLEDVFRGNCCRILKFSRSFKH